MADNVADLTLAHVRKIDQTVSFIWEVVQRHDTRMGRIERDLLELKRDIGELKSDQVLMENRLLNRMDENLKLRTRVEDHDERLEAIQAYLERT
jgi:hypothetical protein